MYERTELASGLRVISEHQADQRSVAIGAWIPCGSRHEADDLAGVTHFLEHLLFKGTPSRTALRIAQDFDAIGGELNAFTTKELTCFHARVLPEDARLAVDTIVDMIANATLAPADVEAERNVVLEEISLHDDTPDDAIYDLFHDLLWPGHPLGRPVEGVAATVAAVTRDQVDAFRARNYVPSTMVVSASGAIDHGDLVAMVEAVLNGTQAGPTEPPVPAPQAQGGVVTKRRDIEQAHVLYGVRGMTRTDERRWALWILNTALGGGMSSRLFQVIREERGLTYNVVSGHQSFSDTGVFNVYAGCRPDRVEEVLTLARAQIDEVAATGITDEEFERARGHVRGSLVMGLDEPGAMMSHLGHGELMFREVLTVEQMVERVEAVTKADVDTLAGDLLGTDTWALAVLAPRVPKGLERFV